MGLQSFMVSSSAVSSIRLANTARARDLGERGTYGGCGADFYGYPGRMIQKKKHVKDFSLRFFLVNGII